jgi:hypothetical protein
MPALAVHNHSLIFDKWDSTNFDPEALARIFRKEILRIQ